MSSVQYLREFIRERLTAAAEEIFTQVEKTIISYEEELDAQRRMMGIRWKPDIKLHRVGSELQRQSSDLQQPRASNEEEASVIQQVFSLANRSSGNQKDAEHQWTLEVQMGRDPRWIKGEEEEPEPILLKHEEIEYPLISVIKEELDSSVLQHELQPPEHLTTGQDQKDLYSIQEGEQQTVQKQFAALIETSTLQEDYMNEEKTRTEQVSFHISPVVESRDEEETISPVSESPSYTGTKKKSFKCDICGRCYTQQYTLKIHYRTHTGERLFSCETCGKSFFVMKDLNRHKKTHTGEKPFSCEFCGKSFCQISILNRHKKTHTGEKPFSCQSCGKSFSRIDHLKDHKRIHTREKPFSCQLCGKSFSRIDHLKDHKRIHTGEKPFSCQLCGKSFCQMSILFRHKTTHTGQKRFSCQSCGKSFCQISILNRHKATHTGDKPFSCQSCGKSFSRIDHLKDHKRIHTREKPFLCQSCGKSFCQMSILNRHKTTHTGEKRFSCESCGKHFSQIGNLNRHMKTHTDQEPL